TSPIRLFSGLSYKAVAAGDRHESDGLFLAQRGHRRLIRIIGVFDAIRRAHPIDVFRGRRRVRLRELAEILIKNRDLREVALVTCFALEDKGSHPWVAVR